MDLFRRFVDDEIGLYPYNCLESYQKSMPQLLLRGGTYNSRPPHFPYTERN